MPVTIKGKTYNCWWCKDTGRVETRQSFPATKYQQACVVIDGAACPRCAPERDTVSVAAVELRDNLLDGGYFVRCRGCSLPARVTHDTGNCPHCGWPYAGAERCSREEYRASRADDAELPPRPGLYAPEQYR